MAEYCSMLIIVGVILLLLSKYYQNMSIKFRRYCKYIGYMILIVGIIIAFNEMKNGIIQGFQDAKQGG